MCIIILLFRRSYNKCIFTFKGKYGCSEEVITVAAMTQIQNVFVTPSGQKSSAVSIYMDTYLQLYYSL